MDVIQPPPVDQLPLIIAMVNGNLGIDKQFEDTDDEYVEMVAVMGVSFNATNAMIKGNVEAPGNNVADGKELFNDARATENIQETFFQIFCCLMVLSSQ
ncbi:hypothetical protein AMTRI_Chr09g21940 [Amborella trichopoda]